MGTVAISRARAAPVVSLRALAGRLARNYYAGRLAKAIFTIYIVLTVSFFIVRLMPGSPVEVYIYNLINQYSIPYAEAREQAAALFGVDVEAPLWQQYLGYLRDLAQGNLGSSLLSPGTSVASVMLAYMPWTLFSAIRRTPSTPWRSWGASSSGGRRRRAGGTPASSSPAW